MPTLLARLMGLPASAHDVESAVDLAIQNGAGERAAEIAAGILPQECPRHRQLREPDDTKGADGVAEPITRLRHGPHRGRVELPAGISEMANALPQPLFDLFLGPRHFVH